MAGSRAENEIEHGKKLAKSGAESVWGWDSPAGQLRAKRRAIMILNGAQIFPGENILEIGCGTGNFTTLFLQSGARVHAIDISPDLLEVAKRRFKPEDQVNFKCARFEDLDKTQLYDAVIGSSILHHLEIKEALRVLIELVKPGHKICFAEPNMLNPQIAVQKNVPWIKEKMGDSPNETAFFRWIIAHELQLTGFTDIRIKPFDWLHPATPEGMIDIVQSLGIGLEKIPLLREFAGSLLISAKRPE